MTPPHSSRPIEIELSPQLGLSWVPVKGLELSYRSGYIYIYIYMYGI